MDTRAELREAIVLGWVEYRERDRIMRLITPGEGRISALARGARGSRKRFGGALDLGNRLRVQIAPGKGDLWHLREAVPLGAHPRTREALLPMALLTYGCELVAAFAQEASAEPRLFGVLEVYLDVLEELAGLPEMVGATPGALHSLLRTALEAKVLTYAGLTPLLVTCAVCGQPLEGACTFDPGVGGGVHAGCGEGERVDAAFLRQLELGRRLPLAHTRARSFQAGPVWLLARFAEYHLGHRLRSRSWLTTLERP